ncbi:MAG: O-antigen ligase family protein [Bacteroidales bacterium]|nr:O-antigen ligase family protein [Bacteroidales bacterium]MCF8392185.1 O-antigen ligase family protein [Bacteroidales bacterium]
MKFSIHQNSQNIYYYTVIFLAASLPLSIYTTSLAEIILLGNWLLEGKFYQKWEIIKKRKSVIFLISWYFLHIIGLIYTEAFNFGYALHDLKIKLPLLILPLIFATSPAFKEKQFRLILIIFALATLSSSMISFLIFAGIIPYEFYDFRDISVFISHIRLALMANLSIFILIYYFFQKYEHIKYRLMWNILSVAGILWLIFFLILLKSLTGLFILITLMLILAWYYSSRIQEVAPRFIIRTLIITIPLILSSYLAKSIDKFYFTEEVNLSQLDVESAQGNRYFHDTTRRARENGNYVWINICEEELKTEWNKVSTYPYDSLDNKQQKIKYTLIRYLSSLGERKDASGVHALSKEDIKAIENGKANHIFTEKYSLYPRIYEIIWEIDSYSRGGDPSGHSVTQRIAYLKAAHEIIRNNFLIGVGTGDVQYSFNEQYDISDSRLAKQYRRRAHNQFVTILLSFGIIGFVISLFAFFAPIWIEHKWRDYLFTVFFIIGMISMLNEDTLETQTGASFFIFFYAFLMYARGKQELE